MYFNLIFFILCFTTGSCFASFAGLIGFRLPIKQSIVNKPSHCEHCHKKLFIWQLFPIFSYIAQQGKCFFCRKRISYFYFILECLGGLWGIYVGSLFLSNDIHWLSTAVLLFLCQILIVTDLCYFLVPDIILLFGFISLCISNFLTQGQLNGHWFDAGLCLMLFLVLNYFYPNKLGGGDVKFIVLLSWYLSLYTACQILLIAATTALLFYVVRHRKLQKEQQLPFIPFIVIGLFLILMLNV